MAHESDYGPHSFNMNKTSDTNMKAQDSRVPLMMNPQSPKASEEQGDSIAKVLEWFSRSSDSSDKHDCEDIIQDTGDDIKLEDLDFEDEINSRPKPENNVYLIIPRLRDEDNSAMMNERDLGIKINVDKKERSINFQVEQEPLSVDGLSSIGSSNLFSHRSPQDTANRLLGPTSPKENTTPKENILETASKKEESRNSDKVGIPDSKPTQHELGHLEDSQSPKIANLRSLWDRGTTEDPRMLVSKPNINSEKETLDQNNFVRKLIEYEKEPMKGDISAEYSVLESKKQSHDKDIANVNEIQSDNITYESLNRKEANVRDEPKDMQAPVSEINRMEDIITLSTTSDKDVPKLLSPKSSSSLDFGIKIEDQRNENVEGNVHSSEEGHTTAPILELERKVKTEEKESQQHLPSTPVIHSLQQNPVPLAKQRWQQQDNRAERIKQLKSFWEKERLQSNIYMKSTAANNTNSSATPTKLNKRFTKSEYDLRSIGTESEAEIANFTVLPLRDRMEKTAMGEGMNSLQFKMLRDFWAGSSKQSSSLGNKTQNPLSQEVKHVKTHKEVSQLVDAKCSLNQNVYPKKLDKVIGNDSKNAISSKTDRGLQSPLKEKTVVIHPDTGTTANLNLSPTEPSLVRSSHCPEPKSGSQFSPKDIASPKPTRRLNKESCQQTRSSGKGTFNGRGNSLRRATSMFAINMESQGQDLPLESKEVSDTGHPQVGKTTESTLVPSPKTPEANLQVKKAPEITKSKHKITERSTSGDSDSQPLARSFVPRDYQHYLGITEKRGKYISPQVSEQTSEIVCTPFQTGQVRCCAEQADTPLDPGELCLGLRPSAHAIEDVTPETVYRYDSISGGSANCEIYIFFLVSTSLLIDGLMFMKDKVHSLHLAPIGGV